MALQHNLEFGASFLNIIKKYANRRLYNVATSSYITLSELAEMVRFGEKIEVRDAKTGQDLTRPTLVQVILEVEQEGHQMLPVDVLCQIIAAYKSPIEPLLSRYLERTMASFTRLHLWLARRWKPRWMRLAKTMIFPQTPQLAPPPICLPALTSSKNYAMRWKP